MKIVFMGTPEFAVSSLDILVQNGYELVGVITVPDKPAGRGHKLQQSAVKKYALEHNLPVLQPEKLKDPVFIEQLQALNADLQVVVAFRMLPAVVFQMPRYGTFNLHASLLPLRFLVPDLGGRIDDRGPQGGGVNRGDPFPGGRYVL